MRREKPVASTMVQHHELASRTKINMSLATKFQFIGNPAKGINQFLFVQEKVEKVKRTGQFPKISRKKEPSRSRKNDIYNSNCFLISLVRKHLKPETFTKLVSKT